MLSEESKSNPILRTNAIKDIVSTLALIEDPIKRSVYIQSTAALVNVAEENIIDACNLILKENLRNKKFQDQRQALENDRVIISELDSKIQKPKRNASYIIKMSYKNWSLPKLS